MGLKNTKRLPVLWFGLVRRSHAFHVDAEGRVDSESLCGIDLDACADEPVRQASEFEARPPCPTCHRIFNWQQVPAA